MKRMKRLKLAFLFVFIAALVGFGIWAQKMSTSLVGGKEQGLIERIGNIPKVVSALQNPKEQFASNKFTLLVVGRDYNHNKKSIAYTKNSRADTIMLLQCDLDKPEVTGISIPRDTKVRGRDGITGKINGTLSRGGLDLLIGAVEDLTGVKPDHTVLIKADAVREIVDAVGGVEVETIDEMHYDDNWGGLHIHLPKGRQHIMGQDAVGFTRFREVNTMRMNERGRLVPIKVVHSKEEGDARRMARQQQLIRAIASSMKSPSNLMRLDSIIDTSFSQLETNFKRLQLVALAQIFKGSENNIKTATLVGGEENGDAYYFIPDPEKTRSLVDYLFNGNEAAGRQLVRVAVFNGTKVKGAAKAAADKLESMLYDAFSNGNADPATESKVVYRTASVEDRARKLAEALGIKNVHKAGPDEIKVEILGGNDPDVYVTIGDDLASSMVASREGEGRSASRVRG